MTPTRAVFRQVYNEARQTMDTFDYLPDSSTKYPFCFVEYGTNYKTKNSDLMGEVHIRVHWYGRRKDVKEIDKGMVKLHDGLTRINSFTPYNLRMTSWRDRHLPNPSDAPDIAHFIADITILYTRKEV